MSKALVTFGTGDFESLLDISMPGLAGYADRWGYELRTNPPQGLTRPASWGKLRAILAALIHHSEVLWVDCDVIILDDSADIAPMVPADAWQGLTRHFTHEGEVPSAGVWYVREQMAGPLEQMWQMTRYMNHPWWEQAALQDLLGYTPNERPVRLDEPTDLYDRTVWLDANEWNALALREGDAVDARLAHCGPGMGAGSRARIMQSLLERSTREQVLAQ